MKIVLLTYTCAKLLCMISKSEKASIIRNYYIELKKLLITYKDNGEKESKILFSSSLLEVMKV